MKKILGIVIIILGVISGLLFFNAGMKLSSSGKDLTSLRSVGGTSIAESYYQSMGEYGLAYSTICYALGLSIITISLGFGGRYLFDNETLSFEKSANPKNETNKASLIPCPNCNNLCSSDAESCPKCGTAINKKDDLPNFLKG